AKPENQSALRAAFSDLPFVRALREHGIAVPDVDFPSQMKDQDLFACRAIKFGIVAGIVLIVSTLGIMIGHKHQHLQSDFPLLSYFVFAGAALLTPWLMGLDDARRPPTLHSVIAALFFVTGVAMAAQPVTVFVNGIGVTSDQSQSFVVRAGSLEPTGDQTGNGAIELPGTQSRLAWLKEG